MIYIKTIGIIIREFKESKISYIGTRSELINWVNNFNVQVILIPITQEFDSIKKTIELCDGIILSGGESFCENDFKITQYLYYKNIPTLGICLGMQGMGKYLYNCKEINVDNHYTTNKYVHKVILQKNSLLYKIINQEEIDVNSRHHSAISRTNLKINALSGDGIIEGLEDQSKKFFLGLQWHPESLNDENSNKILEYFIKVL